jgi:hypothetical protein
LSLFPVPKTVWHKGTRTSPRRHFPPVPPDKIKEIQRIIGSILYYARAINITKLMALSSIAIKQTKGTTSTMEKAKQLLDYSAMNPNATMRFKASDMIVNIHMVMSYLSKANARSRACGHFFMRWDTMDGNPIKLNGAF